MSWESFVASLADRVAMASGDEARSVAMVSWLGAVWALFDAGVITAGERQAAYGDLQRARNRGALPSENAAARRVREEQERSWATTREEYVRHPERLPRLPPWLPDWVIFPADEGRDPQPIVIERYGDAISVQMRIAGDGTSVWRDPTPRGRELLGTATDEFGGSYDLDWAHQTGRIVRLMVRPVPPQHTQALRVQLAEGGFEVDLTSRVPVATLTRSQPPVGEPELCAHVSAERSLRAAMLRLGVRTGFRLAAPSDAYLRGVTAALQAAGVLNEHAAREWLARAQIQQPKEEEALVPARHAIYFRQPQTIGVRLLAVLASERTVTIRWAQLPELYGPGLPTAWVLPRGEAREVTAATRTPCPFVAVSQSAGAPGVWDPPLWYGETTFLSDTQVIVDGLEVTIGHTAARINVATEHAAS